MLDRPIHELLPLLRERRLKVRDLLQAAVDRHAARNGELAAFLHFAPPFEEADRLDAELDAGRDPGPLAGIPVALKDNLCTRGMRTTCGSRILGTFDPPYDATVVRRLRDAGALIVGKTNMDEFAMGSSTENSAFGPTRNPWDPSRVPGGSSGGSAAAVAGGFVPAALGSDTGGSIRQPAAFCGVTGLKPTYGRVSRYGLVAFASSLDQVGPLTWDVRDAARVLTVISGADPADGTCVPEPVPDYEALLDQGVQGLRLGIPRTFLQDLDPEMAASFEGACRALAEAGAQLVDVELPNLAYALPTYYILAPAEASSNLARYDGVRYGLRVPGPEVATMMRRSREAGFGAEVKRRIMLGTHTLSSGYYDAYYGRAQKARTVLKEDFARAFSAADVLLLPTTPGPAFPIGEKSSDPLAMYLSDIYTVAVNLAGLPGLSVPSAPVRGLPAGLQIVGRPWDEARVLACGHAWQSVTDHHRARP